MQRHAHGPAAEGRRGERERREGDETSGRAHSPTTPGCGKRRDVLVQGHGGGRGREGGGSVSSKQGMGEREEEKGQRHVWVAGET